MSTPSITTPAPSRTSPRPARPRNRSPFVLVGAGAAAIAVAAVLAIGGGWLGSDTETPLAAPLQLTTGDAGGALASCIQLTPEILADVPMAFAGTVTAIDGDLVSLDVTRWYVGGDAERVQVTAEHGLGALIGEIDFQVGQPYLISAVDGVVNMCGFSGPATPELQAVYDQAFGA